jgi:hypothetical protein
MPNLGIFDSYPKAWHNPVTMRASAALPAGGNWDPAPVEQSVAGAGSVTLSFTYTQGAASGAFDWQLQGSIYSIAALAPTGAGEWADEALYSAGAVAAGADTQSRVQAEYQTFDPTVGTIETFLYGPIELAHTVERVRVVARESGVTATPGILQVTMECYP